MGNGSSHEAKPSTADHSEGSLSQLDGDFRWPENLYIETRDMAAASFLVYTFAYILDTARRVGIQGIEVDSEGHAVRTGAPSTLERSFTPSEVRQLVENNQKVLAETHPSTFAEPALVMESLQTLQDRVNTSKKKRPIALVAFDDRHQDKELVYAVTKDDVNKRITLCFRGTENELAFNTNWATNLDIWKVGVPVPSILQGKVASDQIWFHKGFYEYIFGLTADEKDAPEKRKFDEIMEAVKPIVEARPTYVVYVTGHSLGAALSSIVAFYLACDESIPKPVTCINFASPRVGDSSFLEASTALEKAQTLRFLRVVNEKDSIAFIPTFNYYHAGFQLRLYEDTSVAPEVTYPRINDTLVNKWSRTWNNSLFASFNFSYDHGDYREQVELNKTALQKMDLNLLYSDQEKTGYTWGLE